MGANVSANGATLFTWDTCPTSANETSPGLLEQLQAWEHGGSNGTAQSASPTHVELPDRRSTWGDFYENSARDVSAGGAHTCAILYNGSVGCWGGNAYGQLGAGNTSDQNSPVQVVASGVIQIAAGFYKLQVGMPNGTVKLLQKGSGHLREEKRSANPKTQ